MTIKKAYDYTKAFLQNVEGASPVFEAKQLIMHITGYTPSDILIKYNEKLTTEQFDTLTDLLCLRRGGEPLQYLLGNWDFYGLNFKVGHGVLIPRSETELLVEKALEFLKNKTGSVIDLCAGSGCIAAAIAKNAENAKVCAVEKYDEAYNFLCRNIKELKVDVKPIKGDIFTFETDEKFDLIVSNPPYITKSEMEALDITVKKEPHSALYGGSDGLDFYRVLTSKWGKNLNSGGALMVEIGANQGKAVVELFKNSGFSDVKLINDYSGLNRIVSGIKDKEN